MYGGAASARVANSRGFHTLRHTYAKIAVEAGVAMEALSKHLGHATVSITTDDYGHFSRGWIVGTSPEVELAKAAAALEAARARYDEALDAVKASEAEGISTRRLGFASGALPP